MTDLPGLRETYRNNQQALLQSIAASGTQSRGLKKTLNRLAGLADALLIELWRIAEFQDGEAMVAVGGYGRAQLFPYSDVDVLVLLPDGISLEDKPELKSRLERFIGSCWDAGLEIGSSVRSLSECLAESAKDITVQTSLLESRLITGDASLYQKFCTSYQKALDPHAFFVAKTLEMQQRHTKFEDTPYALEPNCKESPGGLRDLQIILWVARAAGLGKSWEDLARNGLATPLEARKIKRNEAVLGLIRARLHLLAKRREDRLVFDLQSTVAESFGYTAQTTPDGRLTQRASEVLMRQYYWAAKAVTQLNQILLLNIEDFLQNKREKSSDQARPLNAFFFEKRGLLEVASDDLYQKHPHAILQTFLMYQQTHGVKGFSAKTLRALYNVRGVMNAQFRRDPVNRQTFLEILQQPQGITHAMRLMNQTSVLGRYLWVFRKIVGQMQHDLFHVYTVDQHILMVLRNVTHAQMLTDQKSDEVGVLRRHFVLTRKRLDLGHTEFRVIAASAFGDVVKQSGQVKHVRLVPTSSQLRAKGVLMRVVSDEKPAHIAQHHQDVLIHRVRMKQVVLHLTHNAPKHPQITAQD